MKVVKFFGVVIISAILIITGLFYQVGMGAEKTVFNSEYYHRLVNEVDLSSHIHQGLKEELSEMLLEELQVEAGRKIPPQMLEEARERIAIIVSAFGEAFSPEWLEKQLLLVADDVVALIKEEQEELTAVIDLREGKEQLGPYLAQYPKINIPDELRLNDILEEQGISQEVRESIDGVQLFRSYFLFIPYIIFGLLLLGFFLTRGFFKGLKWFGVATIISALVFSIGIILSKKIFMDDIIYYSKEIPVNDEVLVSVMDYTAYNLYFISFVIGILGLVLLFGGTLGQNKLKN